MEKTYKEDNNVSQNYNKSKDYWDTAKGLQKVDYLETSKYLDSLIDDNLKGIKTYDEVESELYKYYSNNKNDENRQAEADISATRIAKLLGDPDFRLTKNQLLYIHKYIFTDIFPDDLKEYVGRIRETQIKKEEPILNGKSVIYTKPLLINDYLEYDLNEENERSKNEEIDNIPHLAKFISNIWNIHPFREGNTRTTATFVLKYLRKNGYDVNNDLFKKESRYFRDSLVLASDNETYQSSDYSYLESFLYKLLKDNDAKLKPIDYSVALEYYKTLSKDPANVNKNKDNLNNYTSQDPKQSGNV